MSLFFLLILGLVLAASIIFTIAIFSFTIWSDLKGAPFVRSRKDRIATMLELADLREGIRVLELGSGDGTLLIAAAREGAYAKGIEINPLLVWFSRRNVRRIGFADRVIVTRANIFDISLADTNTDVVFVYLLPGTLKKLKEKLLTECVSGTRIISNAFKINGLIPVAQKNNVYVYQI